jgi:hypothetical protein
MRRSILMLVCGLAVVFTGLMLHGRAEAASRGQGVTRDMLPKELLNIAINDAFIPLAGKEAGTVQNVVGHAVVVHEEMRQAYFAAPGDKLYENDSLYTLKQSRCRFTMHNEDVVTLGETASLVITAFADDRTTQEKRSSFSMAKGKGMFYTLRLFKHKGASMDVTTPTAVAGVRGTKLGVEVNETDASTSAYAFEGTIYVTSTLTQRTTRLSEGLGITIDAAGLRIPVATPPEVSQQFQRDTSIEPSGAAIGLGTEGSATGEGKPLPDTGVTDTSTLVQEQNAITLPTAIRPARHEGYFAGMLTNATSGAYIVTYMSQTPQDFNSNAEAIITATGGPGSVGSLIVDGTRGDAKQVNSLFLNGNLASGLPQPMQRTELGYNGYMEWGSWTQPNAMLLSGANSVYDNKGYYVWGDRTVTMPSAISAVYSGIAHGTDWSSGGGIDKSGTFSMNLNISGGAADVQNFQVWVGGVNNTGMSGGTGTITGSSFTVNGASACVSGMCGGTGSAAGAFYGPNAEQTGGVWKATSSAGYANGMFQGAR